jgi:hypothetical protein
VALAGASAPAVIFFGVALYEHTAISYKPVQCLISKTRTCLRKLYCIVCLFLFYKLNKKNNKKYSAQPVASPLVAWRNGPRH